MFCDGIASIVGAQEMSDKIDNEEDITDADLDAMGVKAIDDKTLEVTTTTRVSFFDELMSFPCFYPLTKNSVKNKVINMVRVLILFLGNGAFTMTKWETRFSS